MSKKTYNKPEIRDFAPTYVDGGNISPTGICGTGKIAQGTCDFGDGIMTNPEGECKSGFDPSTECTTGTIPRICYTGTYA